MSLIEWLIVMAFFIPLMRLLGFCYDQLFRPSGRQLDVIEEDICYDEGDLGALIEIFPNLQEMECKDALILHKGDYDDAFKYLIRVSGKRGNKAKIDGLNDSFSSSSTRASAEDKRIEEITSSITDLMDIIRYPIGGEKQPREEVAALRKQIRKQLEEGSFPEVACQCGCNGRPSTICPDGSINYSIHWDCPARILRKEREKYKRYKIRKEIALKNKIERDRARKVKRKKLLKDKLIKEKEEWIERGRQGLAAQSAKEAKARKLNTYMGNPCSKQHSGERETRNGECVSCRESARTLRNAMKRAIYPVDLNDEEKEEILKIYKQSKQMTKTTGIQHHVDHIKPLSKGGEHHPSNLQILTAEENLKKGAKFVEK